MNSKSDTHFKNYSSLSPPAKAGTSPTNSKQAGSKKSGNGKPPFLVNTSNTEGSSKYIKIQQERGYIFHKKPIRLRRRIGSNGAAGTGRGSSMNGGSSTALPLLANNSPVNDRYSMNVSPKYLN